MKELLVYILMCSGLVVPSGGMAKENRNVDLF